MDLVAQLWDRVTTPLPQLSTAVLLGALVAAAVVVGSPALWRPARTVVTIAHEGAHGLVALAAGRRLAGIRLHSDTSGLTVSAGRPTGIGMVLTCAAGYPGPALFGLGAAALLAAGHAALLLWALLALLALLLVQIRNWYGLWAVLATGAVVLAVTGWLPPAGQAAFAAAVTWFLLLAAPKTVLELQRARRRRAAPDSDADQLARLTRLPAVLWVGVFLLVDVGALLLGGWWVLG
ncbi:M50 family metallopeptidase [Geodermatophilus sp. DSM 44513]|uniref:M50 family metallopeptidase n=1 Tax=Geodermatophilus sp. DSM 44513 TaxID=1528104 RepID=UPI00128A6ADB|nr:M50 family metallopeptidase [Geodermatophilus sp. DSM 44513]WNV77736.1 M50 family metallopeptidase [Geodermatophilus sp. DSM 44513]